MRYLIPLLLIIALSSCGDIACIEPQQFDQNSLVIESNPQEDGVVGNYDHDTGGQIAYWHDTGLRSNGDVFVIAVSGAVSPWHIYGSGNIDNLPTCRFCAIHPSFPNDCLCYKNSDLNPNPDRDGVTCVNKDGVKADDYGVSHHPLAIREITTRTCMKIANLPNQCVCFGRKEHDEWGTIIDPDPELDGIGCVNFSGFISNPTYERKGISVKERISDIDQEIQCKYVQGMNAYIGLFGVSGQQSPARLYHLFSEMEFCPVARRPDGKCLDSSDNDITSYLTVSPNDRIFMRDDHDGNYVNDLNTSNDEYHGRGEVVKTIFYDRYYSDNYGKYDLVIRRGVGFSKEAGLIESLVSKIEDFLLGKQNELGDRPGGVIKSMYNSIVKDSGFATIVQISLTLYVVLFGISVLAGTVELSRKDLMMRVVKIGLIIFFVSPASWGFYNEIIVNLFRDATNYVVSFITGLFEYNLGENSIIELSRMDRPRVDSTRFSLADDIIERLFSDAVTKKIWGLFFSPPIFGLFYIIVIYFLIFYFIYVMIMAAAFYITNMIKIIFVLALGPIFFCFLIFKVTSQMFKNWLSFLVARAVEIIILFVAIFAFVILINGKFNEMLTIKVCGGSIPLIEPFMNLKILKSETGRSFVDWIVLFITTGGLIFATNLIIAQIASFASKLAEMSNVQGSGGSNSTFSSIMSNVSEAAQKGLKVGFSSAMTGSSYGVVGATLLAKRAGVADGWNKVGRALPFRGIRSRVRDSYIDNAIKQANMDAQSRGLTGASRDSFIRQETRRNLAEMSNSKPHTGRNENYKPRNQGNLMRIAGVDEDSISRRLNKKLVEEPLKDHIKSEVNKLRNNGDLLIGKDARDKIEGIARKWMNDNISPQDEAYRNEQLKNLKNFIKDNAHMSSSEAAKRLAGNSDAQNKYLQHLQNAKKERQQSREKAYSKGRFKGLMHDMKSGYKQLVPEFKGSILNPTIERNSRYNPNLNQENFLNKVRKNENPNKSKYLNPAHYTNMPNKLAQRIAAMGNTPDYQIRNRDISNKAMIDGIKKYSLNSKLNPDQQRDRDIFRKHLQKNLALSSSEKLKKLSELQKRQDNLKKDEGKKYQGPKGRAAGLSKVLRGEISSQERREKLNKLNAQFNQQREDLFSYIRSEDKGDSFYEKATQLRILEKELGISNKDNYKDPIITGQEILNRESANQISNIKERLFAGEINKEEAKIRLQEIKNEQVNLMHGSSGELPIIRENDISQLNQLVEQRIADLQKNMIISDQIPGLVKAKELEEHNQALDIELDKIMENGQDEIDKAIADIEFGDIKPNLDPNQDQFNDNDSVVSELDEDKNSGNFEELKKEDDLGDDANSRDTKLSQLESNIADLGKDIISARVKIVKLRKSEDPDKDTKIKALEDELSKLEPKLKEEEASLRVLKNNQPQDQ